MQQCESDGAAELLSAFWRANEEIQFRVGDQDDTYGVYIDTAAACLLYCCLH